MPAKVLSEPLPSELLYRGLEARPSRFELADGHLWEQTASDEETGHENKASSPPKLVAAGKLGWVQGVLIPCLLNIWGGIMFLRLGWVVGQAGIWIAILILIVSYMVTTSTALSLCAIVTNGEVKGGGIYYLVSRSLGPKWGSMLGVLFFWAQVIASAMYAVGVAEVVVDLMSDYGKYYFTGEEINDVRVVAVGVLVLLLLISFLGMSCFAKTQLGLFVTMVVAMGAAMIGSFLHDFPSVYENLEMGFVGYNGWKNDEPVWSFDPTRTSVEYNFFTVFAVFFPAATGIMAGANVSGDLAKPSTAIPKGTLWAVFISFWVYFTLIFVLGLSCVRCIDVGGGLCPVGTNDFMSQELAIHAHENHSIPLGGLLYNKIIMANLVPVRVFFFFGVFASSLSSALSSLVGAPRVLQAMARDPVFPFLKCFAKGRGAGNEPVRALLVSFVFAIGFALIGNLDAIATLITIVFLASYGLVNLACFVASGTNVSGWRPSFAQYNRWISLLGCLLCMAVMFLIDWTMCLVCFLVCILVYNLVGYMDLKDTNWGAADDALGFSTAMFGMEQIQSNSHEHEKLFRASPLVMAGAPGERPSLLKFAQLLSPTHGLILVGEVLLKEKEKPEDVSTTHQAKASVLAHDAEAVHKRRDFYDDYLNNPLIWGRGKRCAGAFPVVSMERSLLDGFVHMTTTAGIGKMRPNCVIFGFLKSLEEGSKVKDYEQMLRVAFASSLHGVAVLRDDEGRLNVNFNHRGQYCVSLKSVLGKKDKSDAKVVTESDLPPIPAPPVAAAAPKEDFLLPSRVQVPREDKHFEEDDEFTDIRHNSSVDSPTLRPQAVVHSSESGESSSMAGLTQVEDLPTSVPGDYIDVWWLADDGGFSMLLPHILTQGTFFARKRIRVFTVVVHQTEEEDPMEQARIRMVNILLKLRIKATVVAVDGRGLDEDEDKREQLASYGSVASLDDLGSVERTLTKRYLNLGEMIRVRSGILRDAGGEVNREAKKTAICFVTAPVFLSAMPVKLYSIWLDLLSKDMGGVPIVLLRGNGQQVMSLLA